MEMFEEEKYNDKFNLFFANICKICKDKKVEVRLGKLDSQLSSPPGSYSGKF